MPRSSGLSAHIQYSRVPKIDVLDYYLEARTFPGGTTRNFDSYGHKIAPLTDEQRNVLCDPQTSGGLLVAVDPSGRETFLEAAQARGLHLESFGTMVPQETNAVTVS